MITKPTLLVLGAGASMDYGFPSGEQLLEDIINLLNGKFISAEKKDNKAIILGSLVYYYKLNNIEFDLKELVNDLNRFEEILIYANPASIDDFLSLVGADRNHYKEIGKVCIALCVSQYEVDANLNFVKIKKIEKDHRYFGLVQEYSEDSEIYYVKRGWYSKLWQYVYKDCRSMDDVISSLSNLKVITFNYDHSLEWFLLRSFLGMFSDALTKINQFWEAVSVHHVYGALGKLERTLPDVSYSDVDLNKIVKFFKNKSPHSFIGNYKLDVFNSINPGTKLAKSSFDKISQCIAELKIYTDDDKDLVKPSSELSDFIRTEGLNCFFLGFGFHKQNVKLLVDRFGLKSCKYIYGTAYGFGDASYESVLMELARNTGARLHKAAQDSLHNRFSNKYKIDEFFDHIKPIE